MTLELFKLLLNILLQALQVWRDHTTKSKNKLRHMQKARERLDVMMQKASIELACEVQEHRSQAFEEALKGKGRVLVPKNPGRIKHHTGSGLHCPKCREMLTKAHPLMRKMTEHVFVQFGIKPPGGLHVSSVWRTQEEQDIAFKSGPTPIKTGSKHQAVDKNGKPAARAVDFFCLSGCGKQAVYDDSTVNLMRKVNGWSQKHRVPLIWGGDFKNMKGDFCHFELSCVADAEDERETV